METRITTNLIIPIVIAAFVGLACKCGGGDGGGGGLPGNIIPSKGGAPTIEKVGERLFEAANDGDIDGIMKLFPPEDLAREALECSDENPIVEARREAREELADEIGEMHAEGVEFEMLGVVDEGEKEVFEPGQTLQGCTVNKKIVVTEAELSFRMVMGDEVDGENEEFTFIQIDGGNWYLIED